MKYNKNFRNVISDSPCTFIIGVAGDSGSGKTTFTGSVKKIFGEELVSTISLDDYHTLGRKERLKKNITPLCPEANDIGLLEEHVSLIKSGSSILKPVYNHETGNIDPPVPFIPTKIIILEGLHTFSTSRLRELIDFTLFVNPDTGVKYDWKIRRDVIDRGYKKEDVITELNARSADYKKYVEPQTRYANAVVEISDSIYGKRIQNARNVYNVSLYQEKLDRTVKNISLNFNLFAINSMADRNFSFEFNHTKKYGRKMGALSLDGEFQFDVVRSLEKGIEDQIKIPPLSLFSDKKYVNASEMVQLLLSWRIINKRMSVEGGGEYPCICNNLKSL